MSNGWKPIWELFECDAGSRWAQLKGSPANLTKKDGQRCDISGCKTGHLIHKVGETEDRGKANGWFRDATAEERGRQEEQCHNEAMEAAFGWHGQG